MDMDRRHLAVIFGLICLLAFAAGMKYAEYRQGKEQEGKLLLEEALADSAQITEDEPPIQVYVVGEVKKPGVYKLEPGARVYEAVDLAQPRPTANLRNINMARKLEDGEAIVITAPGEEILPEAGSSSFSLTNSGGSSSAASAKVNINSASVLELDQKLPGIGPTLAQRVVN